MKRSRSALLILLGGLTLAACGGQPSSPASNVTPPNVAPSTPASSDPALQDLISSAGVSLPNLPEAGLSAQSGSAFRIFFVDSDQGSDTNAGNLPWKAWKSVAAVNKASFKPGDLVAFKRGSSFSGALTVKDSGTPTRPIVLTAYGEGALPVFKNPGQLYALEVRGSDVVLNTLALRDTTTFTNFGGTEYEGSGALLIRPGADRVTVLGSDFADVGLGVKSYGKFTRILGNTFRDLKIAYRDENQSYGAVGISLNNSDAEVAYNQFTNCRSTDSPYGADGGAIEIEGYTDKEGYTNIDVTAFPSKKDRIRIHHNVSRGSQGFLEVTETSSSDVTLAYNVSDDYQQFIAFDTTTKPSGYRAEHNTVVRTRAQNAVAVFAGFYYREVVAVPSSEWLTIRNNIFYTPAANVLRGSFTYAAYNFPHDHNVFFGQFDPVGYPLGPGDVIADPQFVNFPSDLRLKSSSPAIDAGVNLGYRFDLDFKKVPAGAAPDAGAYEFQGKPTPGSAPAPTYGPNLLVDPGFEAQSSSSLLTPWIADLASNGLGHITVDSSAAGAKSGGKSALISNDREGFNAVKQQIRVKPNTNYRLTLWVKTTGTLCDTCGYFGIKTPEFAVVSEFNFFPSSEYRQIGVDFNSGANSQIVAQIGYFAVGQPSTVQTDDWSLTERLTP